MIKNHKIMWLSVTFSLIYQSITLIPRIIIYALKLKKKKIGRKSYKKRRNKIQNEIFNFWIINSVQCLMTCLNYQKYQHFLLVHQNVFKNIKVKIMQLFLEKKLKISQEIVALIWVSQTHWSNLISKKIKSHLRNLEFPKTKKSRFKLKRIHSKDKMANKNNLLHNPAEFHQNSIPTIFKHNFSKVNPYLQWVLLEH